MPEPRGEFARIAALVAGLPQGEGVVLGPGDDAAVLRPRTGFDLVATTDTFVEGRHFRLDLMSPAEAGARFAAANLSDLAAMAAVPRWALVSLVAPATWSAEACESFERACAQALSAAGAAVVGGNLAATSSAGATLIATLALLGEVEPGRAWTRRGARAGDLLAVTGVPGSAGAALALALRNTPQSWAAVPEALRRAYIAPPARVAVARALAAAGGVRAAIDLSDGLAGDLGHLCSASGIGARLEAARLPMSAALEAAARTLGKPLSQLQLAPSDDYELLLAVDSAAWAGCVAAADATGAALVAIGEATAGPGIVFRDGEGSERPLAGTGWDHFVDS